MWQARCGQAWARRGHRGYMGGCSMCEGWWASVWAGKSGETGHFTAPQNRADDRVFTRASQILKVCRGIEYSERGRRTPPRGGTTMQKEESRETPVPAEGVKTPQRPPQGRQPPSQPQTSHPRAEAQSKAHQGASYAAGARAKPQASKAGAMRQPAVP